MCVTLKENGSLTQEMKYGTTSIVTRKAMPNHTLGTGDQMTNLQAYLNWRSAAAMFFQGKWI